MDDADKTREMFWGDAVAAAWNIVRSTEDTQTAIADEEARSQRI